MTNNTGLTWQNLLRPVRGLAGRLLGGEVERRVALAVRALEDARDVLVAGQRGQDRDRYGADREEVLRDALDAWRANPLARRIVALTTQYVVGAGVTLSTPHLPTQAFLQSWWNHRLNRMAVRVFEWSDELARAGNLIVLVSTDAAGMSYVRGLPAAHVQEIVTRANDVEQPVAVIEKPQWGAPAGDGQSRAAVANRAGQAPSAAEGRAWPAYDEAADHPNADGSWSTVALHYAINRPVGAAWGESDLAPLLRWLARYSNWLEDRARLNRFRQSFMYVVRGVFKNAAERLARQAELNANPPTPGSILVTDANTEAWGVLHPQLDSFEAGEDGLALKKMLAAGSGNPLHFLAEPESATRTTAEAAGGPTFRHYEQRQIFFLWLLADVARVVVARRSQVGGGGGAVRVDVGLKAIGSDISARDNAVLGQAAAQVATAFGDLRNRGLIDDGELVRMVYKFAGELVDVPEVLRRAAGVAVGKDGGDD